MHTLELDFEQAKAKHLLFKTKLRSILYGAEIDEQPVLSHLDCAVGKWIYSHALKEYGHISEMQQLEKVHANIHESARELIHLYKTGKTEEARKGLSSMELIADNLVALLTVIEMKLKLENHPSGTTINNELLSINYKELLELHNTIRDLDVRIRKQSEELYRTKNSVEKQLQSNFSQAPVAICILRGENFLVELANKLYLQIVDRTEDLIGKPLFDSLPELEGQGIREMLNGVLESGIPFVGNEIEILIKRNTTKERSFFNFIYQPLKEEENNEVTGIMVVCTEVTSEVIARQKIHESETRLNVAVDSAELGMFELIIPTSEVVLSDRYLRIFGYEPADSPTHQELLSCIHPDDVLKRNEFVQNAMIDGSFKYEMRVIPKGASTRWISAKGKIIYDKKNNPYKMLGTIIDITENKLAEEKIRKSNRTLEIALEAGKLGSFELDVETGKSNFNLTCKENFGFEPDAEVVLEQVLNAVHPGDRQSMQEAMQDARKNATRYHAEYRIILQDNTIRWLSASGKWVYDKEGKAIKLVGVNTNITERKKAEEELTLSFEKFRLLADSMPQFIWTGDPQGNLNYYNQAVFDYSGLSLEKINADGWLQIVHPDDRDLNIKKWVHSIQTGEDFLFEHRFRKNDGEYRWQLSRAIPQKNKNGEIQMWVGTSTDIQDQKTFAQKLENEVLERTKELNQLNNDLENKNQELNSFAYISSHDLQEPLRKIQTFVSRIQESDAANLSEEGKNYFNRVENSAKKMQTLINDLLTYSRAGSAEKVFEKVDLVVLLQEVKNEFADRLEEKQGSLEISGMPTLYGTSFQLRQLFVNLISNALKFSRPGIPPLIKISSVKVQGSSITHINAHKQDRYYHISIQDNGIGFDKEYEEKIFEVFQKLHTKAEYEGTGIGLAICKKIAQNHHGFITATSEKNIGTTFDIYLPV
jgi:PAS domain S-box-containing protein